MTIPDGYKQTEVGVIPVDWEVKSLGEVIEKLESGISVNSDESAPDYNSEPSILKTSAIFAGNFNPAESKRIVESDKARAKVNPRADSIIISRMNTPLLVGECGYVDRDYPYLFVPDRLWMMKLKGNSKVCPKWLNYLLSNGKFRDEIKSLASGTSNSMKNIAKGALLSVSVPFPPFIEQESIATALSEIDEWLGVQAAVVAKKRDLKTAAMAQLLRGQKRLSSFSGEWKIETFPKVVWFQEGPGVRTTQFTTTGVKLLNGTNIFKGKIDLDSTNRFISTMEAFGPYAHFLADAEDIVIACSGITIEKFHEKVAFVEEKHLPLCMNTSTMRFKVFPTEIHSDFFYQFLMSDHFKEQVGPQATGSAQLNFGPSHVRNVEINLPPLPEQIAIAEILTAMDDEIATLEAQLEKARHLKTATMQQLLTGATRLV